MNSEVRSSPTGRVSHVPSRNITMLDLRAWVSLTLFKVSSKNPNQCKRPIARFYIFGGSHNLKQESYVTFAEKNGSVTVTYYLKVRTNLYAFDKLPTIFQIGF